MTGAEWTADCALCNDDTQWGVVAPTRDDLKKVAFGGISGLLRIIPDICYWGGSKQKGYNASDHIITLYNGSQIYGFSAQDPDRLRGPQFHGAWVDELAAWPYPETLDQLLFGLRLGLNPQLLATTTPRPTAIIKDMMKNERTVITRGTTYENAANLSPEALKTLEEKYGGTRLGRQELYGEVLDDLEGNLWSRTVIEDTRMVPGNAPQMDRIIVAIDPSVTNNADSDETGIIVVGKGNDGRFYVLEDASGKMSTDRWAQKAVSKFYKWQADRIVAETNNGGDLVESVLRTKDRNIPYTKLTASRGKLTRAEPIAALYEQYKVSHVGQFKELEDQMVDYTAGDIHSPDRMDALVWGLSQLSAGSGKAFWRFS